MKTPRARTLPVPPGLVLHLDEDDYQFGHGSIRLQVVRVREDLSAFYRGQWVWVEGIRHGGGQPPGPTRELVRAAALSCRPPPTTSDPATGPWRNLRPS